MAQLALQSIQLEPDSKVPSGQAKKQRLLVAEYSRWSEPVLQVRQLF